MEICVQPAAFHLHEKNHIPVGPMLSQHQPKQNEGKATLTQVCDLGVVSASGLGPQSQAAWQDARNRRGPQPISQANLKQAHV